MKSLPRTRNAVITLSLHEYREIEYAVNIMRTVGDETLRLARFSDGSLALAIDYPGKDGDLRPLSEWSR